LKNAENTPHEQSSMSLDAFRKLISEELQNRADARVSQAVNVRARPATKDLPASSVEEIALVTIENLAEARAYGEAIRVVTAAYKKLTDPQPEEAAQTQRKIVKAY
jgi:hypothetical protein